AAQGDDLVFVQLRLGLRILLLFAHLVLVSLNLEKYRTFYSSLHALRNWRCGFFHVWGSG
ncbi:MAG: hypothetical protein D8B47_07430, partial [Kingella sp. (in: b-proteobacteria)]